MIRPFQRGDLDALYAVALATGLNGADASHLYEDGRLVGHIYAAPYALLEPDFALVVEDEEGVAGYAVGTSDTATWVRRLESEWWPALRATYDDPSGGDWSDWSADQMRAHMIHHPAAPPSAIAASFPAHLHLNLLPRLQGQGVGSRLFAEWMDRARQRDVAAVHIAASWANHRGLHFWTRQGFAPLPDPEAGAGRTVWMGRAAP